MTKEEARKILAQYVKACREDDMITLEEFSYEEVIEAMSMGAEALSVPSLSSDLDEATEKIASDIAPTYPDISWECCFQKVKEGIIAGAKWQREQMMKEAVEDWAKDGMEIHSTIVEKIGGIDIVECPVNAFYEGQKVRIIIVKED